MPRVRHPHRKLSDAKVVQIRRTVRAGEATAIELALKYHVSPTAIYLAAIGATWPDVEEPPARFGAVGKRRSSRELAGKLHTDQTVTWISKTAMAYLTSLKYAHREAVGKVLDRVILDHRRYMREQNRMRGGVR